MAQINFDASRVEPATGFDTVPAGWYNVMVDQSELKPTNDGAGTRLNFRYVILDGQYQGRKIFHGLNLQNANAQTVEIAFKQLSALAHAVGHLQVGDSSELHNRPLKIKVKVRPADGKYDEQNDITQWKNINEQVGAAPPAAAGFQPPPAGFQPPAAAPGFQPPAQPAAPAQGTHGWGAPPAAPAAPWGAPPAPPAFPPGATAQGAPAAPPAGPSAAPAGWTAPTNPQPWANQQPVQAPAPAAPAQPAAPAAPHPAQGAAPHPAQGAAPPWHRPS